MVSRTEILEQADLVRSAAGAIARNTHDVTSGSDLQLRAQA